MRPTEVLMMQADLVDRLSTRGLLYDVVQETVASMWDVTPDYARIAPEGAIEAAAKGETFLIDEGMTDVVMAAADSLDDSDRIDLSMFPSQQGFMRFDNPLTFTDIRGQVCKIHWITWSIAQMKTTNAFGAPITRRALVATIWNDLSDPDDAAQQILGPIKQQHPNRYAAMRRAFGRWSCVGAYILKDGRDVGPLMRDVEADEIANAQSVSDEIADMGDKSFPPLVEGAQVVNVARLLWATVLLMGQEMVTKTRSQHTKAETKVLRRNRAHESLQVITLRRRSAGSTNHSESSRAYDHRWICRGHFAWRKCGESHPMAQPYELGYRARVWVAPYVKGPEGTPVRTAKKIYKLAR